jgi:glycosyltransferase involved in cell wall biosynthesis
VRITVVTELAGNPDEGMRNWTRDFVRAMAGRDHEVELIQLRGAARLAALRPSAPWRVRRTRPDAVQYVPYSGLTRASLLRLRSLASFVPGAVKGITVLQAADDARDAPAGCAADVALFASDRLRRRHSAIARGAVVVPPVVDAERFRPAPTARDEIRRSLGIGDGRPMVLHVGHLAPSRGLETLGDVAREGNARVTMVASTSTPADAEIDASLRRAGVTVLRRYLPDIERYYQAADVYLFPVEKEHGSVEIPLSVLEAIACGTPVVTTPFGGLPELFPEGDGLVYAEAAGIPAAVRRTLEQGAAGQPELVAALTYEQLAEAVETGWSAQTS